MASFTGAQAMAINQLQKNLVAEPLPGDRTGSVNDGIRFVEAQLITVLGTPPANNMRIFVR
jgi:hypothetical protein